MRKTTLFPWQFPRFFVLLSCTMLFSFGIHDIQLQHSHQSSGQGGRHENAGQHTLAVSDYLHATDRKLFFLIFLICISFGSTRVLIPYTLPSRFSMRHYSFLSVPERYDVHLYLFKTGILHPKLYA